MPDTHYAQTADGVHVAYQVFGSGPLDLAFTPWAWNNVETAWEEPGIAHFFDRLGSFARVLVFDQRGTGLSDPVPLQSLPTLENWVDDLRAVLDAAGSREAAIVGHGDGGLVSLLFAASLPDRTSSLVLIDSYARLREAEGYAGVSPEAIELFLDLLDKSWGKGELVHLVARSRAQDEPFTRRLARAERLSQSPGAAVAIQRLVCDIDLTWALPTISVPSLVISHVGNPYVPMFYGRHVADRIDGARFVELAGEDHLYWAGDVDALADEIERFLTGATVVSVSDRALATVLFTDIVGSTDHAASLGDQRWRRLLDSHDEVIRRQLDRFRGREVKTTGDGFHAVFDGPGRAVQCACAIADAVRPLGLEVRVGLHAGEVELRGDDVAGLAVHIGARVGALAGPNEVLVSSTVRDLVAGSGIEFADRGEHELKGVPGRWRLYAVER